MIQTVGMKYLRTAKGCTRADLIRNKDVRKNMKIFFIRDYWEKAFVKNR